MSAEVPDSISESKLDDNSPLYPLHLSFRNCANLIDQPLFTHSSELIRHGLSLFPPKGNVCFTWIKFADITCQRHYLDPVKELICGIITYS